MNTELTEKLVLQNDIKTLPEFEKWRNENVEIVSKFYDLSNKTEPFIKKSVPEEVIPFLKCMKQFTRQACLCDEDCYDNSIDNINIHINYFNLGLDTSKYSYRDNLCSNFGLNIIDGKFYGDFGVLPYFDTKVKLINSLRGICDENYDYFTDLQCANYEIKEGCQNYDFCSEVYVFSNLPKNCKTKDATVQIKMIDNLMGISLYDKLQESLKNTRHIKRSVDNLQYGPFNNTEQSLKSYDSLESSNLNVMSNTSLISNSIVFSLLFATIGYYVFSLIKKKCTRIKIHPEKNSYECPI